MALSNSDYFLLARHFGVDVGEVGAVLKLTGKVGFTAEQTVNVVRAQNAKVRRRGKKKSLQLNKAGGAS